LAGLLVSHELDSTVWQLWLHLSFVQLVANFYAMGCAVKCCSLCPGLSVTDSSTCCVACWWAVCVPAVPSGLPLCGRRTCNRMIAKWLLASI